MNILFVLYGGVETNSFLCLSRFAKELHQREHECTVVLHGATKPWEDSYLKIFSAEEVLKNPNQCFPNGKRAEVIHAWTPRQNVVAFVRRYQALYPTPLFVYSEDDEMWLTQQWMERFSQGICERIKKIFRGKKIPLYLSEPIQFYSFLKSADATGIITPSLQKELPLGVHFEVLMPGLDFKNFSPHLEKVTLRAKYHLNSTEKLIVYCGGVNEFTGPNIRDLCCMVQLLNQRGYACRLLRSGIRKLSSIPGIKKEELKNVLDLGLLPDEEIPDLMSLADVFVQPGRPSPFEEGRLPCKIIEFMAMGIPTILPNCNVGLLVQEQHEAMTHKTGTPQEMANLCEEIFTDPLLESQLRKGARQFAEKYFDIQKNTDQLEELYQQAISEFEKKRKA